MRRARAFESGLWTASVGLLVITVMASRVERPRVMSATIIVGHPRTDVGPPPAETLTAAAGRLVATDPFRIDRRPAAVRYRPEVDGTNPSAAPPKPVLAVDGIVGSRGCCWAAVLEGVPGHTGPTVVRAGDTVGGLRIRRIGWDTLVVMSGDTTWRLTVRHSW